MRLLNRSTRSVSLTEAGQALLAQVKPAVSTLGSAIAQVRKSGERPSRLVRVHSFRSAAETFLQPMLASFHASFPDVVLDLTLDDRVVDIVAEGYDVALRLGEVIEKDMIAVRLGEDLRQIVVASPDYLKTHGRPQTPKDLRDHTCIRWRWPGDTIYNWEFHDGERWFAVAVDGPLIVSDKRLAVDAAAAGVGLTMAVERLVAPLIAGGPTRAVAREVVCPLPRIFPLLSRATPDGACHPRAHRYHQGFSCCILSLVQRPIQLHSIRPERIADGARLVDVKHRAARGILEDGPLRQILAVRIAGARKVDPVAGGHPGNLPIR